MNYLPKASANANAMTYMDMLDCGENKLVCPQNQPCQDTAGLMADTLVG
jgi:hypothetical protein